MAWIVKNQTHALQKTCCGYNILDECIKNSVESSCPREKGFRPESFIVNLLAMSMEEVREFACGSVKTIPLCKAKHPWCTKQLRKIWSESARGKSGPKPLGLVFGMIQISNAISSVH